MLISSIIEGPKIESFLKKRSLILLYQKAKHNILIGNFRGPQLKVRNPKSEGVFYFRINRKYRALGIIEGEVLKVFHIDDHQKS